MVFVLRNWQEECKQLGVKVLKVKKEFPIEACPGSGKTRIAGVLAKILLNDFGVDHVIYVSPSIVIQKGVLEEFGSVIGLDCRSRFFSRGSVRQSRQNPPQMDCTVTLYQEFCCEEAITLLDMWMRENDFRFATIFDEIHHACEISGVWGDFISRIADLSRRVIYMSGTFFRGDHSPVGAVPKDDSGNPRKDYQYSYRRGVAEGVVRSVSFRYIDADVSLFNSSRKSKYTVKLSEVTPAELVEAKKQVLHPHGECIRQMIEEADQWLMNTRQLFPNAACLFVTRPGGSADHGGSDDVENKHVHQLAKRIREITGANPTVVTHKDKDAAGKISTFRKSTDPYLVAVNMVSEGCDIPRIRSVALCRCIESEMLFRQIIGRSLRTIRGEDDLRSVASIIHMFTFPVMMPFAAAAWDESKSGINDRRCQHCGRWPCECPCHECGEYPCICVKGPGGPLKPDSLLRGLDAIPTPDGGQLASDRVLDAFVRLGMYITKRYEQHRGSNPVEVGHIIQISQAINGEIGQVNVALDPVAERERLCRKIVRVMRTIAFDHYNARERGEEGFREAFTEEINKPFDEGWKSIQNTWTVERLQELANHLEQRLTRS